ncbi:methyltransferase-like protein [Psychroflexus torquis ATCC 700755]|uniref:Methyltransferase-like protein n=1 Tax=Psychroflexus torquis (strain ATCC 700755 / CIP 106069 / ACAM 623) TaxID=313595 RepID=K4IGS6_PSYTT|nr:L-histidine N(alpha)-methyltransferase [Psychroflexus torquis]AFU69732.1 methyltransferase-like protein [Psychroflexus torquis ATCC 700755]
MNSTTQTTTHTAFEEDVIKGLTDYPKHLSSKFIYDKKGDKLFQDIMAMPEYYLTNSEYTILKHQSSSIAEKFKLKEGFDLIELGAGDGKKTKLLLSHLTDIGANFNYLPVDISQNVLDELGNALNNELPKVSYELLQGSYFEVLNQLSSYNKRQKVILVLGSNIGNLMHEDAIDFLSKIEENMSSEDLLFMGFDQKKHPQTVLDAYNDPKGYTEAFNKNLFARINEEFDANFDLDSFFHWETYDPETGTAKSFLVSSKAQKIKIPKLELTVEFKAWETIHTEISQKYDDETVEWLSSEASLNIERVFKSENGYYKNYTFKKK